MKSITALSLLVASAHAIPTTPDILNPFKRISLEKRDGDYGQVPSADNTDEDSICGFNYIDWDDRQTAADVWYATGAGYFLDSYINNYYLKVNKAPDNWLQHLNQLYKANNSDGMLWECATIGGSNCVMNGECSDYFISDEEMEAQQDLPPDEQIISTPTLYYINYAAAKAHEAYSHMDDKLSDWATKTGFDIDSLVDEWGPGDEGMSPWALASAAFGIASGLSAELGPVSGALGVLSGIFGIVDATSPEAEDPTADVKASIGKYFDNAKTALQDTLNNAFGVGDYDMNALPAQTEDYYNDTPLGRFFADGKFLMNNVAEVLDPAIEQGNRLLSVSVIMAILKSQDYFIFVNTDITDPAKCTGRSQTWLNDQCYAVSSGTEHSCWVVNMSQECSGMVDLIEEEKWDKLIDSADDAPYQLDYTAFFNNAYDCAKNNPDGDGAIDPADIPYDGTMPSCFFNLPVKKGTWNSYSGEIETVDL